MVTVAGPMQPESIRRRTSLGMRWCGQIWLACEVTGQVAGRFADGAWLVELAPVQDPALVAGLRR